MERFEDLITVAGGWFDVAGFLVWCLWFGSDFLYARESAPGFACGQIQDEDAAGAGISHIGEFSLCVDAYVVEVAVGQDSRCFQGIDLVDFVAPEVDAVELGAAWVDVFAAQFGCVEDPQVILVVGDDALDTDELLIRLYARIGAADAVYDFSYPIVRMVVPGGEIDKGAAFLADRDACPLVRRHGRPGYRCRGGGRAGCRCGKECQGQCRG